MKKVIEGRLYDTEKAENLGCTEPSGHNKNDFTYFCETLYRTKSGAYFLHGEGHGNSRYGVWHGNSGGWGEKIMQMSPQAARTWAEENLSGDDYIAAFGEPEEAGDSRVALNLTVSAEFKNKLLELRENTGKSMSKLVEEFFKVEEL